jgi:hypothetical protein
MGGYLARDDAPHLGLVVPDDRLDAVERGLEWGAVLLKAKRLGRRASPLRANVPVDARTASSAKVATDASGRGLPHGRDELRLARSAHAPDGAES